MQDRRLSVRMRSAVVGVSVGPIDTTLTQDLKLHKICDKFAPKILSKTRDSSVWNAALTCLK